MDSADTPFSQAILAWYDQHGRKSLPWHHNVSAYGVWVSEIMLQQTQVATVIPYYQRFMAQFSDVECLANAELDAVLHQWSGLGYYARGRNLHKAAQLIRDDHGGRFPTQFESLLKLPGIGRSTAGAILAFSTGTRHAILDGNVKRVLCRYHAVDGWPGQAATAKQLWQLADQHTPHTRIAEYTQAIMDFGASCCTRHNPGCASCPLQSQCIASLQESVAQYPTPKPRKKLPIRSVDMLLLMNERGDVLLQQRPPTGIWGGLWSLPELPEGASMSDWCHHQLGYQVGRVAAGDIVRHTFSHFHLDIRPLYLRVVAVANVVMESGEGVWYNSQNPDQRGLAAPIQRLIKQIPPQIKERIL
ncbi:MAG: A/G-specific adenine glycosylase [Gammaproteobacteria bacterium]|nr:A/G-specific adenine glycosylase [Gammaproteobacteria bacterium]